MITKAKRTRKRTTVKATAKIEFSTVYAKRINPSWDARVVGQVGKTAVEKKVEQNTRKEQVQQQKFNSKWEELKAQVKAL